MILFKPSQDNDEEVPTSSIFPSNPCVSPTNSTLQKENHVVGESCVFCGQIFFDNKKLKIHHIENHIESFPEQTCVIGNCTKLALNYYSSVKLSLKKNTPPYENISMCDSCMSYVPLQEQNINPPKRLLPLPSQL